MTELEYAFNQEHNVMVWHHRCPLDIEYMLKLIKNLHRQEAARPPFNRFVDLSQVESISLSYADLNQLTKLRSKYEGPVVKSGFYSSTPLGFGVARMYQALMEENNVEVGTFRDLNECADWLGVPVDVISA